MKTIDISTKKYLNIFAIVDDTDFEFLNQFSWHCDKNGYARCTIITKKTENQKVKTDLSMHRIIMKALPGQQVDHIDLNPLNNQRSNLRICTNQENSFNRKLRSNNATGYKGVSCRPDNQTWRAGIMFNYKNLTLGHYQTKEHAALAYNFAAKHLFKDFAFLNQIQIQPEIFDQIKQKVEKRLATYNLVF